jgi:prephenate dehydrogenase
LGFDPSPEAARVARDRLCVDRLATLEEVAQAEVVFLAVPPDVNVSVADAIMAVAGETTLVTDCSSVKTEIAQWAQAGKHSRFVPGHPMAGHEKGGAAYASAWMFRSARWILTPVKATAGTSLRTIEGVVKAMGAVPVRIDAAIHDRHVATVSHLPHVIAALLVNLGEDLGASEVGGGSWRDMTRVGGVDPELWTQIMLRNRVELARVLQEYEGNLALMRKALEDDDRAAVREILDQAHTIKSAQATPDVTRVAKRGKR